MKKFNKKIIVGLLASLLIPNIINAAGKLPESASDKEINVYINNDLKNIPSDMGKAYLDKDTNRVMVPIRYISEELGAYINFYTEEATKKSGILIGGTGDLLIKLEIGSKDVKFLYNDKENEEKKIDMPAILYDERTYVPIRFISEALGLEVNWDNGKVLISGNLKKTKDDKEIKEDKSKDEILKELNIEK